MREERTVLSSIRADLESYSLVSRAIIVADEAHKGQLRKSDGSPYIHHPIQVGLILARHNYPAHVVAAGILHDVIEDTGVSEEELRVKFGGEIADLVMDVTEPSKKLPWKERKRAYLERLRLAPIDAVGISIADRIHNKASFLQTYKEQGESLFLRFNADFRTSLENDRQVLEIYKDRLGENHPLMKELEKYMKELEEISRQVV
ncbi:MAG: bifunctional (p)ppGpp synthetase/guanosine-3',5'-bis(diphosphate) 3'-pyrophosphohydrolase [Candidatus Blackburnbacteria bacterium]|nr:bifunctional (p)ppGpp synthetase/guanosine-3',5'-bis(diphosphate) 3'-pyrophosphohydrolase [Candidatus Blackburnbacteria bacterium]